MVDILSKQYNINTDIINICIDNISTTNNLSNNIILSILLDKSTEFNNLSTKKQLNILLNMYNLLDDINIICKLNSKLCDAYNSKLYREKIQLNEGNSFIYVYYKLPIDIHVDKKLYKELWNIHPKEKGKIKIYGKEIYTPRWQQSYGQDYYYSGMLHKALPIEHPYMKQILEYVNKHSELEFGINGYKQILMNWYQDGGHYIGPHSDDERQLVPQSPIYSFSFGQERTFVITNKKLNSIERRIKMRNNSLVIMGGEMQKYYRHSVPKDNSDYSRINITMRLFK